MESLQAGTEMETPRRTTLTASDRRVGDWLIETRTRLDAEEAARRQLELEQTLHALTYRGNLFPMVDPDQGYPVRRRLREPGDDDE